MKTETGNSLTESGSLGDRLTNWGRWQRQRPGAESRNPVDVDDARMVHAAINAMGDATHRNMLMLWFGGGLHKSVIASRLKLPRTRIRFHYRRAQLALAHHLGVSVLP